MSTHPHENPGPLMEPGARRLGGSNPNLVAAMSIAISLKRIADALEGNPAADTGFAADLRRAIEDGASNGAQNWIAQMVRHGR